MMQLDLFPLGATSDALGQRTFRQLKRSGLLANEETYQQLSLDSLLAKLDIEFQMTPSQREFLFDKGELEACVSADQLPLEAMSAGKYVGIIADLMSQAFARDLPIPLSVHALEPDETWQNDLSNGHCDFRTMVVPSGEDPRFSFTEDFFQQPLVMATTTDTLFVNDLYRLGRRKIGVTNQPSVIAELQKSYPEIEFIAYGSVQQALSKVVGGDLFGYIDEASTVANEIQRTYPSALKIGATLEQEIGFAMAVPADQPELLKLLNTLALRIGGDELSVQNAYNNWISVRSETAFDYRLFWQVVGVIAVIALILFINNLRLRKMGLELHRASITDALTGVGNRLRADQLLSQPYREARTGAAQPLGILLCDIDHFKLINDRFGHQVGDEALKYFAKTVSECLPANTSLCRWGGRSFWCFCPVLMPRLCEVWRKLSEVRSQIKPSSPVSNLEPVLGRAFWMRGSVSIRDRQRALRR